MSHFPDAKLRNRALFEHIIEHFGGANQTVKAAEEYAEVAASIARAFNHMPDDEVAIKDVAAEMADAEIMRQQLCLICPKLPIHIEVAYRMKLEAIARRTNFQGQLDL